MFLQTLLLTACTLVQPAAFGAQEAARGSAPNGRAAFHATALQAAGGGLVEEDRSSPAAVAPAVPADVPPAVMGGVTLPLHALEPGYTYARELSEIRDLRAGWVHMIVVTRQPLVDSIEVPHTSDRTPSFEDVDAVIRRAREIGLRVFVTPVVLIRDPGPDDWRGTLRPTDRAAWFASYGSFVLRLAELAQAAGAEVFCVGSELASLERETEHWRSLIVRLRTVFDGWLTYSANWDHFATIEFWDQLDFASMTGYFTLSESADPTVEELAAGWRHAGAEMQRLADFTGRPVVFSEIGVPSQRGAAATPWDYTRRAEVDLDLQRRAFEAFGDVFLPADRPQEMCRGFFLYDWWGLGGPSSGTYTARRKPAEAVWKRLLKSMEREERRRLGPPGQARTK